MKTGTVIIIIIFLIILVGTGIGLYFAFFAPKKCPSDCSGNGVCDKTSGQCDCTDGYLGDDCSNKVIEYEFHQGKFSPDADMGPKIEKSVQDLKKWCNEHPDCKGFQSEGWMKNAIQSSDDWNDNGGKGPTDGLYIKSV